MAVQDNIAQEIACVKADIEEVQGAIGLFQAQLAHANDQHTSMQTYLTALEGLRVVPEVVAQGEPVAPPTP